MISKGQGKTEAEKFFVSKVNDGTLIVSKDGTCFNTKTKRYIGLNKSNNKYPKISMMRQYDKKIFHIQLHRLVWILYKGDIKSNYEINHIDGNTFNYAISNLEEITHDENVKHAHKLGLIKYLPGETNPNSKLTNEQVAYYRNMYANKKMSMRKIAKQLNINRATVSMFINNKSYIR